MDRDLAWTTPPAETAAGEQRDTGGDLRDRPVGDLVSRMIDDVTSLLRQELELAKTETREELRRAASAGAMLGAAGMAGSMSLVFGSLALARGLSTVMPRGMAYVVLASAYGAGALRLLDEGRRRLAEVNPVPQQTVETLKEGAEWARHQAS